MFPSGPPGTCRYQQQRQLSRIPLTIALNFFSFLVYSSPPNSLSNYFSYDFPGMRRFSIHFFVTRISVLRKIMFQISTICTPFPCQCIRLHTDSSQARDRLLCTKTYFFRPSAQPQNWRTADAVSTQLFSRTRLNPNSYTDDIVRPHHALSPQ